jgi:hypothetical protein
VFVVATLRRQNCIDAVNVDGVDNWAAPPIDAAHRGHEGSAMRCVAGGARSTVLTGRLTMVLHIDDDVPGVSLRNGAEHPGTGSESRADVVEGLHGLRSIS